MIMNDDLRSIWQDMVITSICLKGLKKNMRNICKNGKTPSEDRTARPSKYKARVFPT
jgi:hypothetical protein